MTDKTLEPLILPQDRLALAKTIATVVGVGFRFVQHQPKSALLVVNQGRMLDEFNERIFSHRANMTLSR